jgi:hypothetical protein
MTKKIMKTALLILLCAFSLFGVQPNTAIPRAPLGKYVVETFRYGITINNNNQAFYNLTPYNFYLDLASQTPIFDWKEDKLTDEFLFQNPMLQIVNSFHYSLGLSQPHATIKIANEYFTIKTHLEGKDSFYTSYETNKTVVKNAKLVQTLTFNDSDLILDRNLNLLNTNAPISDEDLKKIYGAKRPTQQPTSLLSNYIYIVNTREDGAMKLDLENMKDVQIETNRKLVMMVSKPDSEPTVRIKVFGDLNEAWIKDNSI